jgi:hypothetical protein
MKRITLLLSLGLGCLASEARAEVVTVSNLTQFAEVAARSNQTVLTARRVSPGGLSHRGDI